MLNAIVMITTTTNEHCIEFFEHTRIFRRHFNETNQKIIFKQICIDFFDALKIMIVKLYIDSKIKKIESRLRNEIQNMHDDLIQKFIFETIFMIDKNQQQKQQKKTLFSTN